MDTSANTTMTVAIFGVILALTVVGITFRCSSTSKRILLGLVSAILLFPSCLIILVLNPWLVDARFATYRAFYKDIEIGMTRSQVKNLIQQHYPDGGSRVAPILLEDTDVSLDFFMNPESNKEPNCEGIFLTMQNDQVTRIFYSAD